MTGKRSPGYDAPARTARGTLCSGSDLIVPDEGTRRVACPECGRRMNRRRSGMLWPHVKEAQPGERERRMGGTV